MKIQILSNQRIQPPLGDAGAILNQLTKIGELDCFDDMETSKLLQRMYVFFNKADISANDSFHTMRSKLHDLYLRRLQALETKLCGDLLAASPSISIINLKDNEKFPVQVTWHVVNNLCHAIVYDQLGELGCGSSRWVLVAFRGIDNQIIRSVVADITHGNDYNLSLIPYYSLGQK